LQKILEKLVQMDQYKEGMTDRYDEAFGRYVRTGGMPGSYVYKTEDRQYDYKGVQVVDICRWLRE
jgi:predicted AAA+ superfamily ATPase